TFSPLLHHGSGSDIWAPMAVGGVCLVRVAAVIKIVLAGAGPVDMGALRLLGLCLMVGGISSGAATLLAKQSHLVPSQVSVPVIAVFLILAAERQQRALTLEQ